ncbi:hypothetical protein K7X08_022287 [Anisodus acutangulus]|uniref:Uncharacterized protein n=1 Tax=Anisodus acutangulus TaxID=402998 RepID=A0A9Q1RJT6_9SOLA|nr:hypothetical protein K7X08_022287 [Anisodus acutangulus]
MEEDKGHIGKNKPRIIKTPAQVEGLEKFYQEHKYPTESMKLEVAQKDSCGSTKQGDDNNFDHREVESRRLTDVIREVKTRYREESNLMEDTDTPSGSSSSLRDARFSQNVESFDMATSRYLPCNEPTDLKSVKPRTDPSGYLKVKGQVENASITAVKRQLGSLYRQDGPSLGVEFDPLPPGAFESSAQTPVDDPEYAGEPAPDLTPDFTKVKPRFTSCNKVSLMTMEEEDLECKPSNFIRKGSKHRYCPERELSSKVEKDYIHVDRPAVDENYNVDRVKIPGIKN